MSYSHKSKEQLGKELEKAKSQLFDLKRRERIAKTIEAALKGSEARFRSIFENSTIGMYKSIPRGKILLANPALLHMLGYDSFDELAKRNLEKEGYEPSYDRALFKKQMEQYGKVIGLEATWLKKDGTRIYVRESAVAFYNKKGKITHYEGTVEDITEYTKTVIALRNSEEKLRNIFLSSPHAISLIDLEGKIIDCNRAKTTLYGYKYEELIGKNVNTLYPERENEMIKGYFEKLLHEGSLHGIEFIFKKKNGEEFIGEFSGSVVRDVKGKPSFIVSITHDITSRKQTEELLKNSEEKYRLLFEYMLNGLILFETITDDKGKVIDGKYIEVNSLFENISGIKREHVIGKTQKEIFGFADPVLIDHLSAVIKYNKPVYFEYHLRSVKKTLEVYAYSPKKGQIAAIFNDITSRKKVEQELLYEKNLLETFMDHSLDYIYFKDKDSRFIRVNKAWAKYRASHLNSDPERVVGLSDVDFFSKEIAEQTRKDEKSIIESGKPLVQKIEVRPGLKNRKKYLSTTKIPLYDTEGNLAGTFGISRDITSIIEFEKSLQESEKELRELNATKDKFFSIVAHDLKNPFGSIINFSSLLMNSYDSLDKEKLIKYITAIFETSKQGYNLLENLMEWSRSQTGKIIYNPVPLNINSLVEVNISLLELSAIKKNIIIQNKLDENLIAYADPNMVSTVIRNLLSNAVKFTEKKGLIKIYSKTRKKVLEVFIQDTGIGISKQDQKKLFRIDEDYSTRGTDDEKGTGLGLIIAKEFIEKNKGTIKVKSDEGKGSTFSFTLPILNRPVPKRKK